MASDEENTATAGDFYRLTAKSWLALPGIERLPKFHRLCREIVRNGDTWLKKNRGKIEEIKNARDVKLFLIRNRGVNFLSLARDAENASDPEVRQAARDALIEWLGTDESATLVAETDDYFDWISANRQRIESLYSSLAEQPVVIRSTKELDALFVCSRLGQYEKVNKFLDHRFSKIRAWWKRNLGIPSHRSSKAKERILYRKAALLKTRKRSWREVALKVDPDGYAADPKQCVDRIRKGVGQIRSSKPKSPFA